MQAECGALEHIDSMVSGSVSLSSSRCSIVLLAWKAASVLGYV